MINLISVTSDGPFQPSRVQFVTDNGYTINVAPANVLQNKNGVVPFYPDEVSVCTTSSITAAQNWKMPPRLPDESDQDYSDFVEEQQPKQCFVTDAVARLMGRYADGYILGVSGMNDIFKIWTIVNQLEKAE